ncbi:MAG: phosphate-starvation-inducible PsiE family protein [Pseudomonadota bacterium]
MARATPDRRGHAGGHRPGDPGHGGTGRGAAAGLLLLFIYLEILTMVGLYFQSVKLPIRYPFCIAMVAIARYITIGMKEMDGLPESSP